MPPVAAVLLAFFISVEVSQNFQDEVTFLLYCISFIFNFKTIFETKIGFLFALFLAMWDILDFFKVKSRANLKYIALFEPEALR